MTASIQGSGADVLQNSNVLGAKPSRIKGVCRAEPLRIQNGLGGTAPQFWGAEEVEQPEPWSIYSWQRTGI